jgi:hypothetical protein
MTKPKPQDESFTEQEIAAARAWIAEHDRNGCEPVLDDDGGAWCCRCGRRLRVLH